MFSSSALGSEISMKVGGRSGVIVLPPPLDKREDDWTSRPLQQPKFSDAHLAAHFAGTDWGRGVGPPVAIADVEAAVVRIDVDIATASEHERLQIVDEISDSIRCWFLIVCEWLEAATGQRLRPYNPAPSGPGRIDPIDLWETRAAGAIQMPAPAYKVQVSVAPGSTTVSLHRWRWALGHASGGDRVRVEHQLLGEARLALAAQQFRKAVLEAATAAEVSLTAALSQQLAATNETSVVEEILRKYRGLSERINLCKVLRMQHPENLVRGLGEPRNHAIHKGTNPTSEEATEAVRIAAEVLKLHSPLP
jgi:HEPN domain-containing protein